MHKPRHSLGLLAALLGGTALDSAYRPKVPTLPVGNGYPRHSNKGGTAVPVTQRPAHLRGLSRKAFRLVTKADRRAAIDAKQRGAR
jgi:hypothetical protein